MSRRRWLVIGLCAWAALGMPAASAHQRAVLVVESPAEGATVPAGRVDVVISASGGALASVDFAVRLDGRSVDVTGDLGTGSVFTAHSLRAGEQVRLRVPVSGRGEHELRVVYAPDPHDPRPEIVRHFSTDDSTVGGTSVSGGGVSLAWPVVLGALALLAAAVVVRRRRLGSE